MGPATCCSDVALAGRGQWEALAASLHGRSKPSPGVDGLRLCARGFLFSMHIGSKICKSEGFMSLHLMVNVHAEAPRCCACRDSPDISFPRLLPAVTALTAAAASAAAGRGRSSGRCDWVPLGGETSIAPSRAPNACFYPKARLPAPLHLASVCTPTTQGEAVVYCHWWRNSKFSRLTLCIRYVHKGVLVLCTKKTVTCRTGNLVGSKEIFGPCRCKELMDAVFCLWMIFAAHISSERANKQDRIM